MNLHCKSFIISKNYLVNLHSGSVGVPLMKMRTSEEAINFSIFLYMEILFSSNFYLYSNKKFSISSKTRAGFTFSNFFNSPFWASVKTTVGTLFTLYLRATSGTNSASKWAKITSWGLRSYISNRVSKLTM